LGLGFRGFQKVGKPKVGKGETIGHRPAKLNWKVQQFADDVHILMRFPPVRDRDHLLNFQGQPSSQTRAKTMQACGRLSTGIEPGSAGEKIKLPTVSNHSTT
jgi:hypothetical protein